jgi:CDP-paratose 2-epimerase
MTGRKALITGGAGFVGSNYAKHLLDTNAEVVVFDNLARGKGCENNLQWLRSHPKSRNYSWLRER